MPRGSEPAEFVELSKDNVKDLMCRAHRPILLGINIGDGDIKSLKVLSKDVDFPGDHDEEDCWKVIYVAFSRVTSFAMIKCYISFMAWA